MKVISYFRFGSADSIDKDVLYVVDKIPSKKECKDFCSVKEENRNLIVIEDGFVVDCYKGTPDEVNNSLNETFWIHEQEFSFPISGPVKRCVPLKVVRASRVILSFLSRTQYRTQIKEALSSYDFSKRIQVLNNVDFCEIEDNFGNRNGRKEDILKNIAFQLGQTILLLKDIEVYTKARISLYEPAFLTPFLLRKEKSKLDFNELNKAKGELINKISNWEIYPLEDNKIHFGDYAITIDMVRERIV